MGKLGGIVVAIAIACGLVWMNYSEKGDDKQELREVAFEVFAVLPDYEANQSEYEFYFDMYHDDAFEKHYRMGGKRRAASFDEEAYWTEMFGQMITSATADGEDEVAESLRSLQAEMLD